MNIELDNIKVYNPNKRNENVYCSKVMLDSNELQFQLQKTEIEINKETGKCKISISDEEIKSLFFGISNVIISKTSENSEKWFGKKLSSDECSQIYKEACTNDILHCFIDSDTIFFDSMKTELDIEELPDKMKGICLIKCGMVVFTKTSFFIRWELSQFKFKKDKTKISNDIHLSEYSIVDLEEHNTPMEEDKDNLSKKIEAITLF